MNEAANFLKDKCGKFSALRLALFVYLVPIVLIWAYISYIRKEIQPLDTSLISGLGLILGGKTIQHFSESKEIPKNPLTTS